MRAYQKSLLDPAQITIVLIDHESQVFFGMDGDSRGSLLNAAAGLAGTAKTFHIPIILSGVEEDILSGPLAAQVRSVYPAATPIRRSAINAWEDKKFKTAVAATQKKKLLIAGLWTEVCVALPSLAAMEDGYEVYVVTDACASCSSLAHQTALQRVIQAGAKPVTWQACILELQRDWDNKDTGEAVAAILEEHGGAYGLGADHTHTVIGGTVGGDFSYRQK